MRILYVTNGFPFPLTSGYLRHYHLVRELGRDHAVTLLSFVPHDFCLDHVAALEPFTEAVHVFRRKAPRRDFLSRMRSGVQMVRGVEPSMTRMQQAVDQLLDQHRYDVAVFSGKHTFAALRRRGGTPIVADICDAASVRIRGQLKQASWRQWPWVVAQYCVLRQREHSVLRTAQHSVFASARDRDALTDKFDPRVSVVPNGIDGDYWQRDSVRRGVNQVVFSGAMHYPPNSDCALHLIRDIWPRVRAAVPDARLSIVGRDPGDELVRAGAAASHVTVTGYVEDMRPYLDRATVFAAPLRFAAGIQNKVLEAMAMELPVIASPAAAAGVQIEHADPAPVEIASGAENFAQAIIRELRSAQNDPRACRAAGDFARRYFSWQASGRKLNEILVQVAEQDAVYREHCRSDRPGTLRQSPVNAS